MPFATEEKRLAYNPIRNARRQMRRDTDPAYRRDGADRAQRYREAHPEATAEAARQWRVANPERTTATMAKGNKRFKGLSVERFDEIFAAQGGVCAICGNPETAKRNGKVQRLAIDHDHACCPGEKACGQCTRGLLCGRCNAGIGQMKDDPERLRKAAAYLEREAP